MKDVFYVVNSLALLACVAVVIATCVAFCDPLLKVLGALSEYLSASTRKLFTVSTPQVQPEKTAKPEAAQNVPEQEPEANTEAPKPSAYCIECGTPIRRDPVSSIVLPGTSYLTFECPECGETSLKPLRSTEEVGDDSASAA